MYCEGVYLEGCMGLTLKFYRDKSKRRIKKRITGELSIISSDDVYLFTAKRRQQK